MGIIKVCGVDIFKDNGNCLSVSIRCTDNRGNEDSTPIGEKFSYCIDPYWGVEKALQAALRQIEDMDMKIIQVLQPAEKKIGEGYYYQVVVRGTDDDFEKE